MMVLSMTLLYGGLLGLTAAAKCPRDMGSLRSTYVANSYDESKMAGFFYEIAYEDIMQKGETCQWFNETIVSSGISEMFGFTYSKPGSAPVRFDSTDESGVYLKYMGTSEGMPTVVVDATLSEDGSHYETVTEYTCSGDGAKPYEEIKIGARTPTVSPETMAAIELALQKVGIDTSSLTYVDHEGCEYAV